MRYHNGNKYVGEFVDDFPEGFGTFTYVEIGENGERSGRHRYEGDFKRGKRHGKGLYVSANGDSYTGMFENNVYQGKGTLKSSNGDIYEGEWRRGRASGKSNTIKYRNGDVYIGGMKAGFLHGEGEFKWRKSQGSYKGEWFKGQPQGRGVRIFLNGNKFTGSFYNGRINGDGVMSYANGASIFLSLSLSLDTVSISVSTWDLSRPLSPSDLAPCLTRVQVISILGHGQMVTNTGKGFSDTPQVIAMKGISTMASSMGKGNLSGAMEVIMRSSPICAPSLSLPSVPP
jgi:hypothetical protein